ncbi:MAG TPA: DMT family transporter [Steroidobacteraceae bacterium]|nr:DMT family transporter [Steroidobacteraceae bacterium]
MSVFKSNSSIQGVVLGLAGFFVFPLHDALAKLLVRDLSVWEIMFVRSSIILLIVCLINGTAPFPRAYRSPVRSLLAIRALIIVAAWALYYSAARWLALGELVTIYFGSPILVALMAGPVLREQVSSGRWLAVGAGFVGVIIACRPGWSASGPVLLALAAAVLWSVSTILIRLTKLSEPTSVNMLMTNLGFFILSGMILPWVWTMPSAHDIALLLALSLAGATGQFLVFEALRRASASTIAPLEFTSLLWAFVIQYAVWGSIPDRFVALGALLIGSSGVVIVSIEWRDSMRLKRARLG